MGNQLSAESYANQLLLMTNLVWGQWSIPGTKLRDLVTAPGFTLLRLSPVEAVNGNYLQMEFKYTPIDPEKNNLRGGRIVFDPSWFWAVREYEVNLQRGDEHATQMRKFEYDGPKDQPPILKGTIDHFKSSKGSEDDSRTEYTEYLRKMSPVNDFSLAAYDLPEPGGPVTWFNKVAIYITLISILCILIAFWLRRAVFERGLV